MTEKKDDVLSGELSTDADLDPEPTTAPSDPEEN